MRFTDLSLNNRRARWRVKGHQSEGCLYKRAAANSDVFELECQRQRTGTLISHHQHVEGGHGGGGGRLVPTDSVDHV